jgi:hypothetical protein
MTFVTNPFVKLSFAGKSFKEEQASMKEFFHRNPTLACVEINNTTMKKSKKCTSPCAALAKIKLHQLHLRP